MKRGVFREFRPPFPSAPNSQIGQLTFPRNQSLPEPSEIRESGSGEHEKGQDVYSDRGDSIPRGWKSRPIRA